MTRRARPRWPALAAVVAAAAAACSRDPHGMIDQPRYEVYGASDFFEDGRAMRPLVEGTVPQQRPRGPKPYLTGRENGREVSSYPLPLSRELVQRGRHDFEIYCAACHGYLGDGESRVGASMALRPPPSLVAGEFTPGHLFVVAGEGFGLMPGYADVLPVDRRWGVAAYVEALRRSRRVPLDEAPPDVRAQLTGTGGVP